MPSENDAIETNLDTGILARDEEKDQARQAALQDSSTVDATVYPNTIRRTAIVTGVALALFVVGLDMTIVATAIPRITDSFSGIDLVGWYSSAFFITLACFQPFWGKTYQYFSLKYTFMLAVFIFEVGSLLAGIAPSSTVLIIGRAITGAGGAGIATGGYAILTVVIRPQLRPIFTGLVTTVYSIASVIGPIMGGAFAEHATWRWCFYVSLPFGGTSAFIICCFFRTPKQPRPKQLEPLQEKLSQLDPVGITLALGALICFARALQVAGITKSWTSSEVLGLLVGFVVILIAFVLSQLLLDDRAMMVNRLLRKRMVIVGMIYGFFLEGAFYTLLYTLPIYFQAVGNVSPAEAGLRNLPLLLSCGIGSFAAGYIVSKTRHFIPLMVWASGGGCIGTGLIYTLAAHSSASKYIGYQVLAGLAYGCGLPLAIIVGQASSSPEDIPAATAMLLCEGRHGLSTYPQKQANQVAVTFCFGSSLALAAAQSMLDNVLLATLRAKVPQVDPAAVIQAGASAIGTSFPPEIAPYIVDAYLSGLRSVYILLIGFSGVATLVALTYKWERLAIA